MREGVVCAAVLAALALPVEFASAWSCAPGKPRDKLASADAAFIGKVGRKKLVNMQQARYRYRIRVRRSFKHKLGRYLRLTQTSFDASCGFEWDVGQRVAAYLYGEPGAWSTNLCSLERPRTLRRLARGLAEESLSPRPRRSRRSTCR